MAAIPITAASTITIAAFGRPASFAAPNSADDHPAFFDKSKKLVVFLNA
jgi:hypothetical protein